MKKVSQIKKIKSMFEYTEGPFRKPDLSHYGIFSYGLTQEEIKNYIRARVGRVRVETLMKKFLKIAGANTMALAVCPMCEKAISLMYRHDVERFVNCLFHNKPTYFD